MNKELIGTLVGTGLLAGTAGAVTPSPTWREWMMSDKVYAYSEAIKAGKSGEMPGIRLLSEREEYKMLPPFADDVAMVISKTPAHSIEVSVDCEEDIACNDGGYYYLLSIDGMERKHIFNVHGRKEYTVITERDARDLTNYGKKVMSIAEDMAAMIKPMVESGTRLRRFAYYATSGGYAHASDMLAAETEQKEERANMPGRFAYYATNGGREHGSGYEPRVKVFGYIIGCDHEIYLVREVRGNLDIKKQKDDLPEWAIKRLNDGSGLSLLSDLPVIDMNSAKASIHSFKESLEPIADIIKAFRDVFSLKPESNENAESYGNSLGNIHKTTFIPRDDPYRFEFENLQESEKEYILSLSE